MRADKKRIIRIVLYVLLGAAAVFLTIRYVIPYSRALLTEAGREALCARVERFGIWAPLVFTALMALQIVIAIIPGGPLELVGGMLFGSALGLACTVAGALVGSFAVYWLVKAFGRPLVEIMVPEDKLDRLHALLDEDKLELWVFILFLIPGIPKDLLTYLVPLTSVRGKQFLLLSNLGRFPSLAASVLIGDSLSDGRYWLTIVICAAAAVAAFIGYRVKHHLTKERHPS